MPATLTLTTVAGQLLSSVVMPTCLADVTLAQWIAFVTPNSPEADAVMTGLSPEVLATLSEADRAHILDLLLFLTDAPVLRQLLPTPGLYEVGHCAYGLSEKASNYFAAHPELTRLAQGAYLYTLYREPLDWRTAPAQIAAAHAAVLAQPVTAVYADCQHFINSWERVQNGVTALGPTPPGVLRIAHLAPKAKPSGWLAKLRLGNLWNPAKRAVA